MNAEGAQDSAALRPPRETEKTKKKKVWEQERNGCGHGNLSASNWVADQAHRLNLLQGLTTSWLKLVVERSMRQRLSENPRHTLERTLIRAEANALNATNANAEQVSLRKALRDTERECESEGGCQDSFNGAVWL